MKDDKSSLDLFESGGVGGDMRGGGENEPQQTHLFFDTSPLWEVKDQKVEKIWNEGFKIFQDFPTFIKTRPMNWVEPSDCETLPWE